MDSSIDIFKSGNVGSGKRSNAQNFRFYFISAPYVKYKVGL
jgi:hypothetical protein